MDNLTNCLKAMGFTESEFGMKLTDNIFKTPNKDLFRRIICFTLSQFCDFDEFVDKYKSSCSLPAKVEAQFRSSLKDIVSSINGLYPGEYYLKPINQSYLIAPQGSKIIDFLSSLSKIALSVKLRRAGYVFVPPKDMEQYEKFMNENVADDLEDLDARIEKVETELKEDVIKEASAQERLNDYFKQFPLPDCVKGETDMKIVIAKLQTLKLLLSEDIKNDISKKKLLFDHLVNIVGNFKKLKESEYFCVDGLKILNDLGFKSNISAKINDIELVENGNINLSSLFEVTRSKCEMFIQYIKMEGLSNLDDTIVNLGTGIVEFNNIISSLEENIVKLNNVVEMYSPLVSSLQEEAVNNLRQSKDPLDIELLKYIEFEKFSKDIQPIDEEESSFIELPVPEENLVKWILGDKVNQIEGSPYNSVKNSTLKSSRILSLSGRKLCDSILKRKMGSKDQRSALSSKGMLLRGLCEDRRATLASPSARKERFKIKRFDDQRKPLKPMTAKGLFCSSSPMGHSSFGKSSSSTTLDLSPVKNTSNYQVPDLSASSLAHACQFNLNRSLSEPSLNLTQELLKWNDSSSESDLEDSVPRPPASNKLLGSPQLDDSVELLLSQYKSVRAKLNLSE